MDKTLSYFVYVPPKSNSHGHSVRDKNLTRATKKVIDSFVDNFNGAPVNPFQVTLYYDKKTEFEKAQNTTAGLTKFLGPFVSEWDNAGYEHMDNSITWETNEKNIFDLLNFVDEHSDDSYLPLAKYWFHCSYQYGERPEPYGTITCFIESASLFVGLYLIIPHSIDNEECYRLLCKFQQSLPFKLNSKHFRRLGPNNNKHGQWKLDEQTQARLEECLAKAR